MKPRIAHVLEAIRGPDVLHVGCVGGLQDAVPLIDSPEWVHGHLRRAFPSVWGIDLSPDRVEFLRQHNVTNVFVGNAEDFSLNHQFDSVFAGEVIEHLGNPRAFLEAAKRHLAPEGRIVLTTPNVHGLANVLYAWLKHPKTCSNEEHTVWFCPATLGRLGQTAGLRVASWELIEDYPAASGASWRFLSMRRLYLILRLLIPRRMRSNCFLAVLVPDGS